MWVEICVSLHCGLSEGLDYKEAHAAPAHFWCEYTSIEGKKWDSGCLSPPLYLPVLSTFYNASLMLVIIKTKFNAISILKETLIRRINGDCYVLFF